MRVNNLTNKYITMKHLMLDLETMGTNPGCAVVSIGAVQFDLDSGKFGSTFYSTIDLSSSLKVGLKLEVGTFKWWLEQNENARSKFLKNNESVGKVLEDFTYFVKRYELTTLWGNSASFDCGILKAVYDKVGLPMPWSPFQEKCYRTIIKLFPINYPTKDEAKAHDPIYDCEYQIGRLCQTMKGLRGKNFI